MDLFDEYIRYNDRRLAVYDMDYNPVSTTKWTDIPSVRTYHYFFEAHAGEFRNG